MEAKRPNFRKYDGTDYLPTLKEFRKEFPYDKYDDLKEPQWNQNLDPRNLKHAQKKTSTT